jgi:tyrosinase
MTVNVEIQINNSASPDARYVTWAPSPCRIRVTNPAGVLTPSVTVRLTSVSAANGGAVVFRRGTTGPFSGSLSLSVPVSGLSVPFFVAGRFGQPSTNDRDVRVEARFNTTLVGSVQLMVRVRKNANTLTTGERDRFVGALAQLNNQGLGRFSDFRDMHESDAALAQAHGAAGFLPWHRAYLLDLERELQAIDRSVALPYWRFNQAAPNIFTPDFLGTSGPAGNVQFSPANPLRFWRTDNVPGILRRPIAGFDVNGVPPNIRSEADTLALGTQYAQFRGPMENNPHGRAHTRWDFPISFVSDPATAPRDPLFFLLHCNVDRLWAMWQRQNGRFDPAVAASYDSTPSLPGHNLNDTMWPWNGVTGGTRPPTAPGGTLSTSPGVTSPGLSPRVRNMLDYGGVVNAGSRMGFSYDDVPL